MGKSMRDAITQEEKQGVPGCRSCDRDLYNHRLTVNDADRDVRGREIEN